MEYRVVKMKDAKIREEDGKQYLEGYFSVFDQPYEVYDHWEETVAPGAFSRYLASGEDTKVLWNHDTSLVLGSTRAKTAFLKEDEIGLFGRVEINKQDQDAVNAYARIARGDVDGCSFGFDVARQEEWWDDDGGYHTRILEVYPLYEVSPCTFPAYKSTSIHARVRDELDAAKKRLEEARKQKRDNWRVKMLARLKGEM